MAHEKIGEKCGMGRRENGVRSLPAPSLLLLYFGPPFFCAAPQSLVSLRTFLEREFTKYFSTESHIVKSKNSEYSSSLSCCNITIFLKYIRYLKSDLFALHFNFPCCYFLACRCHRIHMFNVGWGVQLSPISYE